MRTLGIDPGLQVTGYGLLDAEGERVRVLEAGVIRSHDRYPLERRLAEIADELGAVISQFKPEVVAVEELYSHYSHPTTAILMGHVRGLVYLKAAEAGLSVCAYAATRIKKSLTGNGRATKEQMQRMVAVTLGLGTLPEPPDAADALAIALCHCRSQRHHHAELV